MTVPTISLTEIQAFTSLRSYLLGTLLSSVEVVRGEQNRVGEPTGSDFIVMWPIGQHRLSTNITTFEDNIITASISGNDMNVAQILRGSLGIGELVIDELGAIATNTTITSQVTGTIGGLGDYKVSQSQNVSPETSYVGVRDDLVPTRWEVQLDIHGPNSANNARV